MARIQFEAVRKQYPNGYTALENLNLDIADKEFLVLLGPSGCGKSTTLNMIAGLEDISGGELRIGGQRMNERAPKDRDIAMVFQSYALYPHMTVFENMAFPLRLAKVDNATVKDKVTEAAKILDLSNHLDRRPANLSGGQRQRVAMGRAIVRSPKAFLMDEPLSNLDAKLRVQMRTSVSKLQKQLGTTTVYVTHDQTEAMTLGDRVVVLRGGVVQQVGPPQHLYENPANLFVAGFIGSPAMNFVPVELAEGELRSALGDVPLPERLRKAAEAADAPRDLVLGIRPEHFEDAALVDDAVKTRGATFTGEVDVVEEMGSDKYVYFTLQGAKASSAELDELAADSGSSEVPTDDGQVVTRLSVESRARENEQLSVWFDTDKIHLFNPKTGETIR
jgi:multiple sugar transport system ATP-binding protein